MRRSLLPGMRYPCRAPESNHLLTVRGATLQILATSPVVSTSLTLVAFIAFSPWAAVAERLLIFCSVARTVRQKPAKPPDTANIDVPPATFRTPEWDLPSAAERLGAETLSGLRPLRTRASV